jgi:acyl-CoA synthetase (NDP forming)
MAAKEIIEVVCRTYDCTDTPFVVAWTGGSNDSRAVLLAHGIPTYSDPFRAVRAIGRLTEFSLITSRK